MLVTSIFSFFHNVFYPIKDRNHNLLLLVVCKRFQFGPVYNFVVQLKGNSKVFSTCYRLVAPTVQYHCTILSQVIIYKSTKSIYLIEKIFFLYAACLFTHTFLSFNCLLS